MNRMSTTAKRLKAGFADVKAGLTQMALPAAGITAAIGASVKKFNDFDTQMSKVKAVVGTAAADQWPALTKKAQELGATTEFTATQAAQAMENLARAGLKPAQVMAAIGPTLAGASADSLDLGRAAEIAAANLAAFGLPATQVTRIMDGLAFVSRNTKSDMNSLQEGLKFASPTAKKLGISFEDTAAALGALNDVGVDASSAGTALKNAMLKIAKGAKNGTIAVGKFNAKVVTNAKGGLELGETMKNITAQLGKFPDKMKATSALLKTLGIRGQVTESAFAALAKNPEKLSKLFDNMRKKAKGTAAEMQRIKLQSFSGQMTLLSSAVDGVVTAFGKAVVSGLGMKGGIKGITSVLGEAAKAFQFFADNPKMLDKNIQGVTGIRSSVLSMIQGVLQGLRDVRNAFGTVFGAIKKVFGVFGMFTGGGASGSARLVTKVLAISAALGPLAIGLKLATSLFGGLGRTAIGAGKLMLGAITPVIKGLGGLASKVPFLKKFLPRGGGGLGGIAGKALGGLEKLTAQPVRVVNFDEMSGALGPLGAAGAAGPAGQTVGLLGRFRAGLAGFVGRFGRFGAFLNTGGAALMKGGIAAKAGALGLVGAAGAAGFALGTFIDKTFGLSDKISNFAFNLFKKESEKEKRARQAKNVQVATTANAKSMAEQFKTLSARGVGALGGIDPKGRRTVLNRAVAEERLRKFLAKQFGKDQAKINAEIAKLAPILDKIKDQSRVVKVVIDGKEVARAVADNKQNTNARGAGKNPPKARARAKRLGR
jgi:TP901 family phage tail tape measure protein